MWDFLHDVGRIAKSLGLNESTTTAGAYDPSTMTGSGGANSSAIAATVAIRP
jgi:hypothetical protein